MSRHHTPPPPYPSTADLITSTITSRDFGSATMAGRQKGRYRRYGVGRVARSSAPVMITAATKCMAISA
jgi:hypothetical protein